MKKHNAFILFTLISLLLFSSSMSAKQYLSPAELEKWFNSDDELPVKKVNGGQLVFLKTAPTTKSFHSTINIVINQESIESGWVESIQCYANLDPISVTEILYPKGLIKKLSVKSSKNITGTSVAGHKVLLQGVKENASLCVTANVRKFYQNEDKSFSLVNGPYHRKFFDGYYPYHLTFKVQYSPLLKYSYSIPKQQPGFKINQTQYMLSLDSWFEGKLKTEFRFKLKK